MSAAQRQVRAARAMFATAVAFWVVFVGGIVAGVAITQESAWWRPSISHFGSAHAKSALVFNAVQVLDGLILVLLAWFAYVALEALVGAEMLGTVGRVGIPAILVVQGLLLISLAVLPYDLGGRAVYVYHNVAGWLEALVPAGCVVLAPWLLPWLPRWFKVLSVLVAAVLFCAWFLFVIARVLAHGLSEVVAFTALAVWMLALFWILSAEVLESIERAATRRAAS
ncbi:MAG: hypothetical protein HY876_02740 [Coriobacteriales bacterium]|nr:hypothetical protein [Coriobacteriales bacterium]